MNTFRRNWNNRAVADHGSCMSDDAKSFCVAFRNMLRRTLRPYGIEIAKFYVGHYYCSAHLVRNGKYAYMNYSIPRGGTPIGFSDNDPLNGVLFRTASDPEDYRGGVNNFSSISNLPRNIVALFDRMDSGDMR